MLLTLTWLGAAVAGPRLLERRAMKRDKGALGAGDYVAAQIHLRRAVAYQPLREEAVTLLAEAAIRAGNPGEALFAINTMLLEQEQLTRHERSARVRLLRGLAGCMLGRAAAARRELSAIPRMKASSDEKLAMAQACVLAGDADGARWWCDELEKQAGEVAPEIAARARLCRAAILFREGNSPAALEALPDESQCTPADAVFCRGIREKLKV